MIARLVSVVAAAPQPRGEPGLVALSCGLLAHADGVRKVLPEEGECNTSSNISSACLHSSTGVSHSYQGRRERLSRAGENVLARILYNAPLLLLSPELVAEFACKA